MKGKSSLAWAFVILLAGVAVFDAAAQGPVDTERDVAAIHALWKTYAESGDDVERYMALYDEDTIKMAPNAPAVFGKENLRARVVQSRARSTRLEMSILPEETVVAADWAYSRGTFRDTSVPKAGGEPVSRDGKFLTIFRRQADGSLKIYRDCYNSNLPAADAGGTFAARPERKPVSAGHAIDSRDFREAVMATWDAYCAAMNSGDADLWLTLWDESGIQMPPDTPAVHGKPAIEARNRPSLDALWEGFTVNRDEIVDSGDWGFARGTGSFTMTLEGGTKKMRFSGKYLTIFRKQADGTWRIFRDCFNMDGPPVELAAYAPGWVLGTPTNLGPVVNSPQGESSPRVSADGLELYFNSNRPGGLGGNDLWVARRSTTDGEWGEPVNLGPVVNSLASEMAPTLSADGLELYFSDYKGPRPGGVGQSDIWVTRRPTKDGEWGEPVNLGPLVNGPGEDTTPDISSDGLELFFESDRPGGLGIDDIWAARRATTADGWGQPVWTGPVLNTAAWEHCPNISPDGLALFFDRTPAGGKVADLLVATRRSPSSDDWTSPVDLGHSASDHSASSVSADGLTLYFAADRPGGSGGSDIWQVTVSRGD